MSVVVALLAGVGILLWPERFGWRRLALLRRVTYAQPRLGAPAASPSAVVPRTAAGSVPASAPGWVEVLVPRSSRGWWGRGLAGRPEPGVNPQDVLSLLESIAPALEAGLAPASALQIAAEARSGSGRTDTLAALASDLASAAAGGAPLGPLWREAAEAHGSGELLLLSQAWSLTEDLGVRLAQAVRTTSALLEARIAHERRLAGAVAGARATVNVLTVLPLGGPALGLLLDIGPAELYGGSRLTQASLVLGLALAGIGRWWVHLMVRAVARGPVIS